jgi:ubiquinone/menaquinone biosynthesis C-methylase UbiE
MSNVNKNKWDESYDRNENHTLYPKEEVVKFLNRFVRKKLGDNKFIDILMTDREKLRGLDCGCGIGRMTMLLNEFNIDSYGVDISKVAIQKAKELFPVLSNKFAKIDGKVIPFKDSYFDISICESVIDSMNYNVAKKIIRELERVTDKLTFISFISGDDSEHYREYSGDEIVQTKHEKDTVQCWYNWTKINDLLSNTNYKIKWARLVTEESLIDSYKYGRYNVVLEK